MKRLGLLVIGDEILAGHTQDTNSHWIAKRCSALGIALRRIEVCTDEPDDIRASVTRFLGELELDYVITSGGLGPTHDDRTMEGIALAMGVELEVTPSNEAWLRDRVREGHRLGYFDSPEPNDGHLKMAKLPAGSEAMPNHVGTCLGAIVRHEGRLLFTLPGVPSEFVRMFQESVLPLLETAARPHVEELRLYTEESRFYPILTELDAAYPDVVIGSYPRRGHILIRATGPQERAQQVIERMREAGQAYLERREPPNRAKNTEGPSPPVRSANAAENA